MVSRLCIKELSYVLECGIWCAELHRIEGSPREEDYGLGTAWLVPVSVCQSGEPGSSGGQQIKQEEAGREILSGNSGGGEKEPHAPFSRTVCELLGANPTGAHCD